MTTLEDVRFIIVQRNRPQNHSPITTFPVKPCSIGMQIQIDVYAWVFVV
jgi:hypothetical protein